MRRRMPVVSFDPKLNQAQMVKNNSASKLFVSEEIEGLIKVFNDGHVERPLVIPSVPCGVATRYGVASRDVMIDKFTNVWARIYAPPTGSQATKLPLLVYFHGGGFCVGSAAWICYHEFLCNLSCVAMCVIVSVNYRLAPENRLPAAYEDGVSTLEWIQHQASNRTSDHKWWTRSCNFSSLFLAGDSAGANIAHNLATRIASHETSIMMSPLLHKGTILIQPFFGGEARTNSENHSVQSANSILSLQTSDTYWRLSLPLGSNRDHPWCNPTANGAPRKWHALKLAPTFVCTSEMDILKDRNLDFCTTMVGASKKLEKVVYKGVGHAFQILNRSSIAQTRTQEMILHLNCFINHQ